MNYQKLHQDIMSLDRNIRMVTICDTDGKIMYSDHRPGVTNLLTSDESRKSLEMAVNAWKSRSQLAPKIGRGKYVLAEYEKIKRITAMTEPFQFDKRDESLGDNWSMAGETPLKQPNKEKGSQYDIPTENSKHAVIVTTYY